MGRKRGFHVYAGDLRFEKPVLPVATFAKRIEAVRYVEEHDPEHRRLAIVPSSVLDREPSRAAFPGVGRIARRAARFVMGQRA